jgi:hypothetical protein
MQTRDPGKRDENRSGDRERDPKSGDPGRPPPPHSRGSKGTVMKKANELWPEGEGRVSCYPDWPELWPKEYKRAGRHFTTERFQRVQDVIVPIIPDQVRKTFGPPADLDAWGRRIQDPMESTPEAFLLRRLQKAVYKYHVRTLDLLPDGEIRHTNKKIMQALKSKGDKILKHMSDFETFLCKNAEHINLFSSNPWLLLSMVDEANTMQESIRRGYDEVVHHKRRFNEAWHYFLADLVNIYETLLDRPATITRVSPAYEDEGKLRGPFMVFAQESLRLIGITKSDERIKKVLSKYRHLQKTWTKIDR